MNSRPVATALLAALLLLFPLLYAAVRVVGSSDEKLLASVDDDTFYYLLPAHRLAHEGSPSFDGRHPTYGFQPLWFVACTGLAALSESRAGLLRLAILASAALYAAAGALLWLWLRGRRGGGPALLLVASAWSLNFPMIQTYWKAKENGLHAAVLAGLLLLLGRARARTGRAANALAWGGGLGLLVLVRMNAFPVALLGLALLPAWIDRGAPDRWRRLALSTAAALAVLTPWLVFAQTTYGTVWPTSGTAKLVNVSLAAAAGRVFTLDFLGSLRVFAEPSGGSFGLGCLLAAAAVCLLIPGDRRIRARLRARAPGLTLLLAYAAFTHASTFALLRPYFDYATWYRVPQHLAAVAVFGLLLPRRLPAGLLPRGKPVLLAAGIIALGWAALQAARDFAPVATAAGRLADGLAALVHPWFTHGLRGHVVPTLAISLLLAVAALLFRRGPAGRLTGLLLLVTTHAGGATMYRMQSEPRGFVEAPGTTYSDLLLACRWIEANVPAGSTLAGANCGITGYALARHTVINLDGLANSPGFLAIRRDPLRLRRYFRDEGITLFVDIVRNAQLEPGARLFGCLASGEYAIAWASPHVIPHWGGCRAMVIRLAEGFKP